MSREAPTDLVDRVRGRKPAPSLLVVAYPHSTDKSASLHNALHERYVEGIREAEKLGIPSVVLHDSEWNGNELAPYATALVQSSMGEWVAWPKTNHAVFAGGAFREGLNRAIRSMALLAFHRGEKTFSAELPADAVWTHESGVFCLSCTGKYEKLTQPMTLADLIKREGDHEGAVVRIFRRFLERESDINLPKNTRVILCYQGRETVLVDGREDRTLRLEVTDHFSFTKKDEATRAHHFARVHGSKAFAPLPSRETRQSPSASASLPAPKRTLPEPPKKPKPPQHKPEGIAGIHDWTGALALSRASRGIAMPPVRSAETRDHNPSPPPLILRGGKNTSTTPEIIRRLAAKAQRLALNWGLHETARVLGKADEKLITALLKVSVPEMSGEKLTAAERLVFALATRIRQGDDANRARAILSARNAPAPGNVAPAHLPIGLATGLPATPSVLPIVFR